MQIYGYNPRYEDISGGKYHMNIKKKLGILLIVIIVVSGLVITECLMQEI